ncbi:MAG: hypothetical protein U9N51_01410 [Bacteroidota bacterium]|nr:hypothetical protein [Bacteroidota bacterium]
MKKYFLISLFISLAILFSCSSDNIQSGIKGHIEFAEADCNMDQSFWLYNAYNGMVYAIHKDSVNSTTGNYTTFADSVQATNGDFTIGLDPGYYYVFIEAYQAFNTNTEVMVQLNQVTNKEFRWYKCI